MKIAHLSALIALLCIGCSSFNDNDFKKPERLSVLIADSKVFDGMVSALSGSPLTTLKALSKVYITDDTIGVNKVNYVRIVWSDSSGYVPADWLLWQGRVGVLISAEEQVEVFTDRQLKNSSGNKLEGWRLIATERMDEISAGIRYLNEQTPSFGYVSSQLLSLDSLDVAFYYAYKDAERKYDAGDPAVMTALREENTTFVSLPIYQQIFPHMGEPTTDSEEGTEATFGATYHDEVPTGWFDESNNSISEEQWPATIGAIALFDDGSEQVITLPNGLWNSRLGEQVSGPLVNKFRLTLSPKVKDNFTFEVISSNNWGEPDGQVTQTFSNAEPEKKYEFVIKDGELSANLTCSHITIKVRMGNKVFTTQIIGDCPGA